MAAAYYKVDVVLNSQAVSVGLPSPQSVSVTIPLIGPQGPVGATGSTGATGPANSLAIGTVSTGAAGSNASATITGTAPSQTLDLTIPRGDKGDTGDTGATGPANSLAIGTVSTGAEGSNADATITGTAPNQTLNLTIPVGATGATGPQGPAGTATTDASELTSGTLADARLSSNVPLKDAANTFTQNQTLNGTNNVAPNQTAASGSSLMTRSLVETAINLPNFPHRPKSLLTNTFAATTTYTATGGTAGPGNGGYRAFSSTSSGSRGTLRLNVAASLLNPILTQVDWSRSWTFGAQLYNLETAFEANAVQRIFWGGATNYNDGDPANRCVGFRFENGTVYGFCHNGTTYSEPVSDSVILPALRTAALRSSYPAVITSDGSGNVEWFINGTSIGTSTAGPSSASTSNQGEIIIQAQSNDTLANQNLIAAHLFWAYTP